MPSLKSHPLAFSSNCYEQTFSCLTPLPLNRCSAFNEVSVPVCLRLRFGANGATAIGIPFVGCCVMLLQLSRSLHCEIALRTTDLKSTQQSVFEVEPFHISQFRTCLCLMRGFFRCLFCHKISRC